MAKEQRYMALGHYGTKVFFTAKRHPRKAFLGAVGARSARKQYTEYKDGTDSHTGYIANGEWFTLYLVEPWKGV